MTITTAPARNEYTANANQTIFNYTFKIFESTDLNVYITPVGQVADDSTDLTAAYTVTGLGNEDGGTITLTIGTNANELVTIVSDIPSERTIDYQNNGDFRPDTVNNDFDRFVSIAKKIEDNSDRALLLQQSQQGGKPLNLAKPEAGKVLVWNDAETGTVNVPFSTDETLLTFIRTILTVVPGQLAYQLPSPLNSQNLVYVAGELLPQDAYGTNLAGDLVLNSALNTIGLMFEVFNKAISAIPDPVLGASGFATFSDFGADPTGATDSQPALQIAVDFCSVNQIELRGEKGTFKCLSAIMIPKQLGFLWTMPNDCIIDSSTALTAFYTIDAYSDRSAGVSGDFTEGLRINGGRIIPSDITGSYGMALFYVLNTSSIRDVEIRGGDNGLLLTKEFYGFFANLKIRNCAKIGLHLLSGGTGDTGVNANVYQGLFITGCENNLVFDDVAGSSSNVATFNGITCENSRKTNIIIKGVTPVKFSPLYTEGSFSDGAGAGEIVEIDAENAEITLDSGFMNVNLTHDAGAFAVQGDSATRFTDVAIFKREGTLNSFYAPDIRLVYQDDSPNSDFSNAGSGYDRKINNNAPIVQIVERLDSYTADRTIAPIGGNVRNVIHDAITPLVTIDLTTVQLRAGWTFEFSMISYEVNTINTTRRGVSTLGAISVFKDGAVFDAYLDIIFKRDRLATPSGVLKLVDLGGDVIQLQYDGTGATGLPHLLDVEYQMRGMVCRNNGDIVTVDKL